MLQLHIAADVGRGQRINGGGLCLQRHAFALFKGRVVQLGQAVVVPSGSGGGNGIAQSNAVSRAAGADRPGGILQIDILPVHQSDHTGHPQISGAACCRQCFCNGDGNRRFRIGFRRYRTCRYLIQSEVAGESIRCGIFVCTERICLILIVCQTNRIVPDSTDLGHTIFIKRDLPAVISGLDSIGVAALGCNGYSVGIGQRNAVGIHIQRPDQCCFRTRQNCCLIRPGRSQPCTVEHTHCLPVFAKQHILTGNQLVGTGQLMNFRFCSRFCEYCSRNKREQHGNGKQQRNNSLQQFVHLHLPFRCAVNSCKKMQP